MRLFKQQVKYSMWQKAEILKDMVLRILEHSG